jgi:hypothetical protein
MLVLDPSPDLVLDVLPPEHELSSLIEPARQLGPGSEERLVGDLDEVAVGSQQTATDEGL